jgi:hypothetical protein
MNRLLIATALLALSTAASAMTMGGNLPPQAAMNACISKMVSISGISFNQAGRECARAYADELMRREFK